MNEHVVMFRLDRDRQERESHAAAAATLATQSGVRSVAYDAGAATLLVWYQWAAISMGDLLRLVEARDEGK